MVVAGNIELLLEHDPSSVDTHNLILLFFLDNDGCMIRYQLPLGAIHNAVVLKPSIRVVSIKGQHTLITS